MENLIKDSEICGLCRFSVKDEELVQAKYVKKSITKAFEENRCYSIFPSIDIVNQIRNGSDTESFKDQFILMKNKAFADVAQDDLNFLSRLMSDTRLSSRLINAVSLLHKALAEGPFRSMATRRFVLVKEETGKPTIHHISNETTVISHVGQGPFWMEISTIYLGLKTFDTIESDMKKGLRELFDSFKFLLAIEERAIETGYAHTAVYTPEISLALNKLVNAVIDYSDQTELIAEPVIIKKPEKPFTSKTREKILEMLDARYYANEMDFDYGECVKAVNSLERYAKRYKAMDDKPSLKEVIRLLVSASGHDIHEVRNRANIILERVLAPKEYSSPIATSFFNLHCGDDFSFKFNLPENKSGYFVRIYKNSTDDDFITEGEISFTDNELDYNEKSDVWTSKVNFSEYGHYDFVVYKKKQKETEWINQYGTSGRINVIPDIKGHIILEIFVDIHGHTKMWWHNESGHPGLVYNENGEVIRTAKFSDITAHLDWIKSNYHVTEIYLLGVQKRGCHKEDWAAAATSPSPFSPVSLTQIEESLGGPQEFKELVKAAHDHDIKVIVDCIPHVNRHSDELPDEDVVFCYGFDGNLYPRSATDGRFGSWDDGKLLNYRRFEVWNWVKESIEKLVTEYDIDGIRYDSAHAVPIMMKKNNYPFIYSKSRTHEEMVEGRIIVNDRWDEHFVTTGYYDCQCRDMIAIPFHQYLMLNIQRILRKNKKDFFVNIAECFWGHERFLSRSGIIPYNASLFKVCENISHGKSDVREIYHIYDSYYPSVLCQGTDLLGILGNHDERRALNTFGDRGLRAAVTLTSFMSNIIMDYEGSAEGEGWKVYLDNIYVNWNQFEYAAQRSVERFYRELYEFHRKNFGKGYLIWANNQNVAAAVKFTPKDIWLGAFNFADSNQTASLQFDNTNLPIDDDCYLKVIDPLYSKITDNYSYFSGRELKVSRINTIVSFTERVKLLRMERIDKEEYYSELLKDSFYRMCSISQPEKFLSNFAFNEIIENFKSADMLEKFIKTKLAPLFWDNAKYFLELGLKRAMFHIYKFKLMPGKQIWEYGQKLSKSSDPIVADLTKAMQKHHAQGPIIFLSAEADPFSKSGGLANVVYELPRELVKAGEKVIVITGYYRHGDSKAVEKMRMSAEKFGVKYSGKNVRFKLMNEDFEVGVHVADVQGITYYLLDHHELFDGLYWGVTSAEKLRRRVGFARAAAELICSFDLKPYFTFTNDAYIGLFNGIVKCDPYYNNNPSFQYNSFFHIIHNGGWQYFDAYERNENGFDLFNFFNLPPWTVGDFLDPVHPERLNCMAAGIRFANRVFTVSPSYAKQVEYQCDGLERLLFNVIGISNGVGSDLKERIVSKYESSGFAKKHYPSLIKNIDNDIELKQKVQTRYKEILDGVDTVRQIKDEKRKSIVERVMNKMLLQTERNLYVNPDAVLFTMIHRITEQKGYQLLLDCSEGLFRNLGYQGIMGGAVSSGDKSGETMAHGLWLLGQYYPKSISVAIGFQDVAVPLLASDVFGMPSMNEPGGISQIEAFVCGCLVVARATGGLRDTVFPIREVNGKIEGNGFLFSDFSSWAFYDAMERAMNFFKNSDEETLYQARRNAEKSVYYWDKPARNYIEKMYDTKEIIRYFNE